MKTLLILLAQNSAEQNDAESMGTLISILSVSSITLLLLLVLNLVKVYKQKKRIKFLEDQLNS